jgi:hypothetical protein
MTEGVTGKPAVAGQAERAGLGARTSHHVLALVCLLALAARLGGVGYGLPYFVHPDESILVPLALGFLTGDLNPHFFNWPSGFMYLVAALFALYGIVLGATTGGSALEAFARDPAAFYFLARLASAVIGALTVALTYRLGAMTFGPAAGLMAGAFLAINLQHVVDSHFATTDVPVTCAVLAAVIAAWRYWERGRVRDALLAGLAGGLAASVKYNGGLAGAAFVLAHVLRTRADGELWRGLRSRAVPVWLAGAVVGFLAGTPFAALSPAEFLHGLFGEVRAIGTVQFGNEGDPPGLVFHLLHSLPQAMGAPLLLCAAMGVAVALARRSPAHLILLAFPLPYLGVIARWRRGRLSALAVAAVLVSILPAARLGYYELLLRRADSRELAGQWIEQNIPDGARVAMERYSPPIRWGDASLGFRPMLGPPAGLAERVPRPRPGPPMRLKVVPLGVYDLDALRGDGVDYVVLSSFVYKRHAESCETFAAACRFYRELERSTPLVWAVRPAPKEQRLWVGDIYAPVSQVFARTRPGPTILVYRLRDGG